jgi:hypothetical protein
MAAIFSKAAALKVLFLGLIIFSIWSNQLAQAPDNVSTSINNFFDTLYLQQQLQHDAVAHDVGSNSIDNIVTYHLQPMRFTDSIASCILDVDCHIYYLHIGKTGGTTIEDFFSNVIFPPQGRREAWMRSCCAMNMMERFDSSQRKYCSRHFTSVQISPKNYTQMVQTCMSLHYKSHENKGTRPQRAIALTSLREPIGVTLSGIHQSCNKNFKRRSQEINDTCKRCDFDKDTEHWMGWSYRTNSIYTDVLKKFIHSSYLHEQTNIEVLMIDTADVTLFTDRLKQTLPEQFEASFLKETHISNQEKKGVCDFGMKSPMLKALSPGLEIYRNFTFGRYG